MRHLALVLLAVALAAPASAEHVKLLFVSGSFEYESDASLAKLGEYLQAGYDIECRMASAPSFEELPGLDALEWCDVALFFTRRLTIDGEALQPIKDYCASGKPILGVRTASHGFQNWLEMDALVFGGAYDNHHGGGHIQKVALDPEALEHPILRGVEPFETEGTLYKQRPDDLADDITVLMRGSIPEAEHPVTWIREHNGARVFYTSLGAQTDFEQESFLRLLANAVLWSVEREKDI